ncbi:MAG TPA: His-Xaa-Ser system protein HxsD [Pyrinomonadaceae bacterium]|jgi:His-Xaa-Ser system protein HxsD
MPAPPLSWVRPLTDDTLVVGVDTALYTLEALFRVCYLFTDRCYLFLSQVEGAAAVEVRFTRKSPETDLNEMAGEFSNELVNQKVRLDVADETKGIRELIAAQAFAEADLLDRGDQEADYLVDPRGISK